MLFQSLCILITILKLLGCFPRSRKTKTSDGGTHNIKYDFKMMDIIWSVTTVIIQVILSVTAFDCFLKVIATNFSSETSKVTHFLHLFIYMVTRVLLLVDVISKSKYLLKVIHQLESIRPCKHTWNPCTDFLFMFYNSANIVCIISIYITELIYKPDVISEFTTLLLIVLSVSYFHIFILKTALCNIFYIISQNIAITYKDILASMHEIENEERDAVFFKKIPKEETVKMHLTEKNHENDKLNGGEVGDQSTYFSQCSVFTEQNHGNQKENGYQEGCFSRQQLLEDTIQKLIHLNVCQQWLNTYYTWPSSLLLMNHCCTLLEVFTFLQQMTYFHSYDLTCFSM